LGSDLVTFRLGENRNDMKKQIKILTIILIILVIGFFVVNGVGDRPQNHEKEQFFGFVQDDVASFQINSFTLGLLFKKVQDDWRVKRVRNELARSLEKKSGAKIGEEDKEFVDANSVEVAKSITYLAELKKLEPIATQSKLPATFEINDFSLHVIFYDKEGQELDRLYIGKTGPDPFTSFIKKKGSPDVYLARQDFGELLIRNYEDWLPKK